MSALTLTIDGVCRVDLHMSDFNRLRWVCQALGANDLLRQKFLERSVVRFYDSIFLLTHKMAPPPDCWIVLWDGFNSYLELTQVHPALGDRSDLSFAYVGAFAEITAALPVRSFRLFPGSCRFSSQVVTTPWKFRTSLRLKTGLRGWKNFVSAGPRHRQLSAGGSLVFCGLVRPTKPVIASLLTNAKLLALHDPFEQLAELHWQGAPGQIQDSVRTLYERCQQLECSSAEDYAGVYAVLNICTRIFVLNALHAKGCKVFVNEYGFQSNFDPYDVNSYTNNTFLDFGSSRGACHWYPRTMDMHATGKQFIALRLIHAEQSLKAHLEVCRGSQFVEQLDAFVARAMQPADAMDSAP
jgi:hypothetical protein